MFVDTHCHIHESHFYESDQNEVYERAKSVDIKMVCIGTNQEFSRQAIEYAEKHSDVWATAGVHPHDTKDGWGEIEMIVSTNPSKLVGIGEIGLDYFYTNSPRDVQIRALESQLQTAVDSKLPVSFHVREAFDDFWPIFKNFNGIRGVLHSFTDSVSNMEKGLSEGLYIGLNGISTFTKDETQKQMFDAVPLERILLETDAPFLTPKPHRGKVNEPAFVRHVAEYHANRRGVELEHLARATSANASTLFSI